MEGLLILVVPALVLIFAGLKIIPQYERGIVLTFGKYSKTLEPGLNWIIPFIQSLIRVDIRVSTVDIPQQEVITKDNVPVGINAVVYLQVVRPEDAILKIQHYRFAVAQYAQGVLRDVIGSVELDNLLTERERLADETKKIVDEATAGWGVDVTHIKIQDIELPADMKRSMARQAESERERRAVIIKSQGEFAAAENLQKAAAMLTATPGGLTLRTLETVEKINPDPSKTVIFLLPIDLMEGIKGFLKRE